MRPSLFSEAAYASTLAREFNMVEPEDARKWWVSRCSPDSFDFREADEVVAFGSHSHGARGRVLMVRQNLPAQASLRRGPPGTRRRPEREVDTSS